ncbi:hypothetical protein FQN57_001039 [Myotisia sp. PD_48]|nr:hypothetical protein FQN57_001039 [Myotisia sp. PD_48]
MVYYFTSNAVSPPGFIYVGKDKFENEELISHGWDNDFHVDNLSSAHVYLRLGDGEKWDNIPKQLLEDCAQLTKANSIEGNKKDNVTIIYTPWSNLLKNASMATGQVSFHNPKLTRKIFVPIRQNAIVNRLNKTRVEKSPDLNDEKEKYLAGRRKERQSARTLEQKEQERERKRREELRWQKDHAYDDLMCEQNVELSSNQNRDSDFLDDFM